MTTPAAKTIQGNAPGEPKPAETPLLSTIGWTVFALGLLPVLIGLGPNSGAALTIGIVVCAAGLALAGIGHLSGKARA